MPGGDGCAGEPNPRVYTAVMRTPVHERSTSFFVAANIPLDADLPERSVETVSAGYAMSCSQNNTGGLLPILTRPRQHSSLSFHGRQPDGSSQSTCSSGSSAEVGHLTWDILLCGTFSLFCKLQLFRIVSRNMCKCTKCSLMPRRKSQIENYVTCIRVLCGSPFREILDDDESDRTGLRTCSRHSYRNVRVKWTLVGSEFKAESGHN
ncbi:hypothetical protein J6590_004107 [Homalodisca vitripennis]|nr:hypothetical protein J6590_004107 [Homalodisca vitripennis]